MNFRVSNSINNFLFDSRIGEQSLLSAAESNRLRSLSSTLSAATVQELDCFGFVIGKASESKIESNSYLLTFIAPGNEPRVS